MSKYRHTIDKPVPIRIDAATGANIDAIIASGIAKDRSAAIRAGVAALARGLVDDPRVWVVHQDGERWRIFATRDSAVAFLKNLNAIESVIGWNVRDDDGDILAMYELEAIMPL